MAIKITKQLVTLEDLATGSGPVIQERNGVPLTLTKIDIVTKAELAGDPNNGLGAALISGVASSQDVTNQLNQEFNDRLGSVASKDYGTSSNEIPDNNEINARLGTTGNLGAVATASFGNTPGDVPGILYQDIQITGDFSEFTLHCLKIGKLVCVWSDSIVSHATGITAHSDNNAIPLAFRPSGSDVSLLYGTGFTKTLVKVNSQGKLSLSHFDLSTGAGSNSSNSDGNINIVYGVA